VLVLGVRNSTCQANDRGFTVVKRSSHLPHSRPAIATVLRWHALVQLAGMRFFDPLEVSEGVDGQLARSFDCVYSAPSIVLNGH